MTLKTKIGKADYDALDDSLKTLYVESGDGYKLDADFEDVDGLKAKRDELLGKVSEMSKTLKAFEGIDPDKAKESIAKLTEIEDGQLLKKQQFDEVLARKKGEWDNEREGLLKKIDGMISRTARQELAIKLAAHGVKQNMAEDLATILTERHIKYAENGDGVAWKTIDGLEAVDLDKYIPGLKESKADYFAATVAGGSGASGSKADSGNGKSITREQYDANPTTYASQLAKGELAVTD